MVVRRRRNYPEIDQKVWKKLEASFRNDGIKKWKANQIEIYQQVRPQNKKRRMVRIVRSENPSTLQQSGKQMV